MSNYDSRHGRGGTTRVCNVLYSLPAVPTRSEVVALNGRYERELANKLHEQGFEVIRAPASGSATKRSLPDIAFGKPTAKPIFVELKTTSQNVAYYDESEVQSLQEFALAFSGRARLVARFKQDTSYYACSVENARRTDSNRYAVDRDLQTEIIA